MRVHPAPQNTVFTLPKKKLRRLPHIFSKVLELPFGADADVFVEENPAGFRFFAAADGVGNRVRAHAVVIYPGIMKVVILACGAGDGELEEEMELDRWRFRLPPSTLPALATAECVGGELVVTVPKGEGTEEGGELFEVGNGDFLGSGMGQLVAVQ